MSFTAYKTSEANPTAKKAEQRVVSGETDKVSFSAANFGSEAIRNNQCK
jgi:DNA-directed RNA polymerase I subunit RPA49